VPSQESASGSLGVQRGYSPAVTVPIQYAELISGRHQVHDRTAALEFRLMSLFSYSTSSWGRPKPAPSGVRPTVRN
jgi:hypothetical protein